jgi:uncharacterized protein YggU (UPF0235/DUF167 family)
MPIVEATSEGVKVFIKVVPSALRDELSGVLGNRLKVRVRSQPYTGYSYSGLRDRRIPCRTLSCT